MSWGFPEFSPPDWFGGLGRVGILGPVSWIQYPGPAIQDQNQDPGSRILDPGSGIQDPGSRILSPGSRIHDPGSCILHPGSRILDPASGLQDPGSRIQDPGS